MIYLVIFCVATLRVFARAGQQLNVVGFHWWRLPAYSYLMAAGDFVLWGSAFTLFNRHDWVGFVVAVMAYGTAGLVGAVIAMWFHRRTTKAA